MSTGDGSRSGRVERRGAGRGRAWRAGLVVALVAIGLITWSASGPPLEDLLRSSRAALHRGDNDEARRLVSRALERSPDSARALLIAGEVELALGRPESALAHFARIDKGATAEALTAAATAGDVLLGLRRLSEAESCYRRVLVFDPENFTARRRLARVLTLAGRREAATHYLELVRRGKFDTHELALLGNLDDAFENPDVVKSFDAPAPDDRELALGAAHYALHRHETSEAARRFSRLAAARPHDVEVAVGYGAALVEVGPDADFYNWHAALPREADEQPALWAIRARWAQKNNEPDVAIRCYWEALRRDPNPWNANYQLALLLNARGQAETAHAFYERSQHLKALLDALYTLHLQPERLDLMLEAARQCEALGRLWEAWGWYQAAAARQPEHPQAPLEAARIRQRLSSDSPQTIAAANPAAQFDLSRFPLPGWPTKAVPRPTESSPGTGPPRARVMFADVAAEAGINFTYYNGDDPDIPGMPMRASTGGGVAILDFDGDGWPDIHFTQGCAWPPLPEQKRHLDRLFRNRGFGRFEDVTARAGVGDNGYSQGATVGDYDADGFPDLYVANIGQNRLYRNNGDGTFGDVTLALGSSSSFWTTSCVLADLNGDGLADLYDVTYLAGPEPLERVCHDERVKGAVRACVPGMFQAEQDRLRMNSGDGSFADVTRQAGIIAPDGKGLGIVAGDFHNTARLDLFVANDTTANFFFVNATSQAGAVPAFIEKALVSGCAYDSEGRAQASMGIAVDDADGDGLFDLFVTNFYHEAGMLYLQQPGELFADRTGEAGLKEPTLPMLGFGTQFLDADLDGWPDLVVTNGHVDDFTEAGIPWRMHSQLFRNRGFGRFEELRPSELGSFFERRQLGRSLARVDFNRDGRDDFVVSHLDSPAALVANRTVGAGHFVALQLCGVESNRDAIGTIAHITAGGRTRWKQLTAGDGYQASNQRQLVFGLGNETVVDELNVRWPSGREQRFAQIAADAEYILVEGRSAIVRRPAP